MEYVIALISEKRRELKITLEQLTEGLCHSSLLQKLEEDKIHTDKFLLDSILQRLGIDEDFFESYISNKEHMLITQRIEILNCIDVGDIEKAKEILLEYDKLASSDSPVQVQYKKYVYMCIDKCNGVKAEDICSLYKDIILTTVPRFGKVQCDKLILSNMEIIIIFEYAQALEEVDVDAACDLYRQLLEFLDSSSISSAATALVYAKIVHTLYNINLSAEQPKTALLIVSKAIEFLRDRQCYFYLTKLIGIKLELMDQLDQSGSEEYKQHLSWMTTLEEISVEFEVDLNNNQILRYQNFMWQNYHTIGDVIKKRRKMLGFTQLELAEGICDIKTLSRVENLATKIHPYNAKELLKRLNLTGDLISYTIAYSGYENFVLCQEISKQQSLHNYLFTKDKVEQLEKNLDLNEKSNLQFILYQKAITSFEGDAAENFKSIFEITLSLDKLLSKNDSNSSFHFTKKELSTLCNLSHSLSCVDNIEEVFELIDILLNYYKDERYCMAHFNAYAFAYNIVGSSLGNIGEFERSNDIICKVIKTALSISYCRRIDRLFYDIAWNFKSVATLDETEMSQAEQKKYIKLLNASYTLSDINKNDFGKNFITEKLNNYISPPGG